MPRIAPSAAVVSTFLVACAGEAPRVEPRPPEPTHAEPSRPAAPCVVDGLVLAASGEPVAGALVALVDQEAVGAIEPRTRAVAKTTSDARGAFHFEGAKAGKYALTATSPRALGGYTGGLDVRIDKPVAGVTVRLEKDGGTIAGVARDRRGKPASRVEIRAIRISDVSGDVFYTSTDEAGRYAIGLPHASYAIGGMGPAFDYDTQIVPVSGDGTVALPLDLTLEDAMEMTPPSAEVVAWMKARAIPIAHANAGNGFDDLAPLEKIVGGARVVSLGEATHGTREFFQLKHRMLEFLATRMGFDVFAIEATMPEGFDVNEYVLTGKGDPEKALAGLYFWTWNTEEVLDLIRWMRAWNADTKHPKKLKFYGIDMQTPMRAARLLRAYLHDVDPALETAARADLIKASQPAATRDDVNPTTASALGAAVAPILVAFDRNRAAWEKRSSPARWALARQNAKILAQYATMEANPDQQSIRDLAMANNVHWILDHEGNDAKMVLWAHNAHVATTSYGSGIESMGSSLKKTLKDQLVTIGFAFDRGSFQAMDRQAQAGNGLREFTVPSLPSGGFGTSLALAGYPIAAFDLEALPPSGPVHDWWSARHPTRELGATYSEQAPDEGILALRATDRFDLVLFVAETTSARPVGGRPKRETLDAPTNLDFEDAGNGVPHGWTAPRADTWGYTVEVTDHGAKQGKRSLSLHRAGHHYGEMAGAIRQQVNAEPFLGKHITVSATVNAALLGDDALARLWVETAPAQSGQASVAITSKDWATLSVSIDVPTGAKTLSYGISLSGDGKVGADAFTIEAR